MFGKHAIDLTWSLSIESWRQFPCILRGQVSAEVESAARCSRQFWRALK